MLQRKQTLWLLMAALLNGGVLYFNLYQGVIRSGDITQEKILRVGDHYPTLLIALIMTVVPFITIFMFRNRKQQLRMCVSSIITIAAFISMMLSRVTALTKGTPPVTEGFYNIGAVLPVLALIFIILAMVGIRRDQKLVSSMDRLR